MTGLVMKTDQWQDLPESFMSDLGPLEVDDPELKWT